jgi:hypothetical protein
METKDDIITEIKEIHAKYRVTFEERQKSTPELIEKIENRERDVKREVVDRDLLNRIQMLPGLTPVEKANVAGALMDTSLHVAIMILSNRKEKASLE